MNEKIIAFLNGLDGASDAAQITTYRVYLGGREATVEVHDHGTAAGENRYSVAAEWTDLTDDELIMGGRSFGNPEATIEEALDNVHWWAFRSED